MNAHKTPFTILAIGRFGLTPESGYKPAIIEMNADDLNAAVAEVSPSVFVTLPRRLIPSGAVDVKITSMKQFHPDGLVKASEPLSAMLESRDYIRESIKKGLSAGEIFEGLKKWPALPVEIEHAPADAKPASKSAVDDVLNMVAAGGSGGGSSAEPPSWAEKIGRVLEETLFHIFLNEDFRAYEAAWRGAELLAKRGKAGGKVRLKIVNASMPVLADCLDGIEDRLFEDPPSVILIDLPFDGSSSTMEVMEKTAALAETLLIPAIVTINEKFMHLESWKEMGKLPYIPHHFDDASYAKWKKLRGASSSNWMAATVNRFMARDAYGEENSPRSVNLKEEWNTLAGAPWALGCLIASRVNETGWPTRFTDYNIAKLDGLAVAGDEGERPSPAEIDLEVDRVNQFLDAGVIPLIGPSGKDFVFLSGAVCVSGESLAYQLLLSRMISILLAAKDESREGASAEDVRALLKDVFSKVWIETGYDVPEDLEVTVEETGGPMAVSVSMTPPAKVLSTGRKIELGLNW